MNVRAARLGASTIHAATRKCQPIGSMNSITSQSWSRLGPARTLSSSWLKKIIVAPTTCSKEGTVRCFSSYNNNPDLRSYPQYTVFGESNMLSLKLNLPTFVVRNNTLSVDASKRGRVLLEWVPRNADGRPSHKDYVRFALSVEECGLVLDQIAKNKTICLSRKITLSMDHPNPIEDIPDKVLYITPGQGGMASFKVDYERNGIGGQQAGPGHKSPDIVGPLEVIVQAGELQVILTLIRDSIPVLSGWSTAVEFSMQAAIRRALQGGDTSGYPPYGSGGGSGGGGGPRFTSSDPSDAPF